MIKINRRLEYALMILDFYHQNQQISRATVRQISGQLHLPYDSVARVMQKLTKLKIFQSDQGVQGGYYLIRPLSEINLVELSEQLENKPFGPDCHQGPCEHYQHCNIKTPITQLRSQVKQYFSQLSVAQVLMNQTQEEQNHQPELKTDLETEEQSL